MKPMSRDVVASGAVRNAVMPEGESNTGETTLRLLARLSPPDGLEERVLAGVRSHKRAGRLLAWPAAARPAADWKRGAAAAAIALLVIGGGWGIYAHVQPAQSGAVPLRPGVSGGFSSAGAMRTPRTLVGPVAVPAPEVPHRLAAPVRKPAPAASASAPATSARDEAKDARPAPGQPSVTVAH